MERILCFILIMCIIVLIRSILLKDKRDHFNINSLITREKLPPQYPISVEHNYDNLNNVVQVGALGKINEMTDMVIEKANNGTHTILFNTALRQTEPLPLSKDESIAYGNFLVELMNDVSIYKRYKFDKIVNVSKEQMENQIRLNFHLHVMYINGKNKIPLIFNTIFLFEHLYDDDGKFFHTAGKKNDNVSTYLDELRLNDMPNNGFMPGYSKI